MEYDASWAALPSVVLMTSWISLFLMWSTIFGRPSVAFKAGVTETLLSESTFAMPCVATILRPMCTSFFAMGIMDFLSLSLTLIKTVPVRGGCSQRPFEILHRHGQSPCPVP